MISIQYFTNQKIEYFVTGVTAISVILIILQYLTQPTGNVLYAIYIFDFITVLILAADFYFRARQSKEPGKYVLRHCYEIPGMIPLFVFGIIESQSMVGAGLRAIRLARLFRLIQLFSRTMYILQRIQSRLIFTIIFAFITFVAAAVAMYMVEGDVPGSKITSLGDAFWWAIVTVATVPYGDVYPITSEGRMVASFFMLVGVGTLWVLITTLGGNMIESKIKSKQKGETSAAVQIINKQDTSLPVTKVEFDSLVASVTSLRTELLKILSGFNIICKNCKHNNPDGSLFCNSCGHQVELIIADTKLQEPKGLAKDKALSKDKIFSG